MADRPDPFAFATAGLNQIRDTGLYRQRRPYRILPGGEIESDGHRLIDFASNNYLGLAASPMPPLAGGSGSSALVSGYSLEQQDLERQLAAFEQTDDALVFPTGYAANLGTAAALTSSGDTVFVDKLNHSCLVEGARLSRSTVRVYWADRLDRLERELAKAVSSQPEGRRVIQTDGVFSMDGTLAPLDRLHDLCERFEALLMVDEAHATGVFGDGGRGACEHFGLPLDRVVKTGTLSKAIGGLGGFVAGRADFIDWLRHHGRTQMFSTALPPANCLHAIRGLAVMQQEPSRRTILHRRSDHLRSRLRTAGWNVPQSTGPIVPVIVGDPDRAVSLAERLHERGFLVGCIRPPTVPRGTSRLRISVSAVHGDAVIDRLADAMADQSPAAKSASI